MITIFGIKNCDTVKKALKWLDREGVAHNFHDFRRDGLDGALVDSFIKGVPLDKLINTRGTTWRKLPESDREDMNAAKAKTLMLAHDAIIKRPLWRFEDGSMMVGFGKTEQGEIAETLGAGPL